MSMDPGQGVFTVYAIDYDGTAADHPHKVNELYNRPYSVVIIYTARSCDVRELTEKELKEKGIKYHALVMNKLRADVYIDDRNVGGLQWPE